MRNEKPCGGNHLFDRVPVKMEGGTEVACREDKTQSLEGESKGGGASSYMNVNPSFGSYLLHDI